MLAAERRAKRHWEKFRPSLVKFLKEKKVLRQALRRAEENTRMMFGDWVRRGMNPWEAQREATIYFLLLPDEKEVPILHPDQAPFGQPK